MAHSHDRRCGAALKSARKAGCGALLVTKPVNVRYLSGFPGEDSWALVAPSGGILVTDSRFAEEAGRSCPNWSLHLRKGSIAEETADIIAGMGLAVGFEAEHLPVAVFEKISGLAGRVDFRPTRGIVEALRSLKDEREVRAIRQSSAVAVRAFRRALFDANVEDSENDFAAALEHHMRREGASGPAFPTIVAREPNSSLPHARPSSDRLCDAPSFLVDWGARLGGYNSDLTRLVAPGKVSPRIKRIWKVVAEARKAALSRIRAGVKAASVDAAARKVIADAGFAEFFGHGLGHGVGLEVHEQPTLSPRAAGRLRTGMVVTVEPGIYLPGEGGVRLEDTVLVTARGAKILGRLGRDPGRLGRAFL